MKIIILTFTFLSTFGLAIAQTTNKAGAPTIDKTTGEEIKKQSIAMVPVVVKGGGVSYMQMETIRESVAKSLSNVESYDAFINEQIDAFVDDAQFRQSGVVTAQKCAKIAEFSGATLICATYISITADKFMVEVKLLDVKYGNVTKSATQLMPKTPKTEIENGCMLLAEQLSPIAPAAPAETAPVVVSNRSAKPDMVSVDGLKSGSFRISKTEITNKEFVVFLNSKAIGIKGIYNDKKIIDPDNPRLKFEGAKWTVASGYEDYPVVFVTWHGATEFCTWLGGRLPTKQEWDFAARGGNKSKGFAFSGSNDVNEVAWCSSNSSSRTHKVATKKANELGIYDMSGNVWEWCADSDSKNKSNKLLCGGSWGYNETYCRPDFPFYSDPNVGDSDNGFRLVLGKVPKK